MSTRDFSQRSLMKASLVWGLAAIFYLYELMLLVSPSVMVDNLSVTFRATAEQLGNLAAYYYYAYALMQIPVGLLMDRYGPRLLLTCAAMLCTLGCIIFGKAHSIEMAECGRFIMGVGGSFAVVGCLKLASLWFPVNRFALLTGVMVAIGMMGGVFGQAPVAKCVMLIGWRETMYLGAGLGAVLSAVMWLVISDGPFNAATKKSIGFRHFLSALVSVMRLPQVWIASLYAGLMFVPTTGFGQLWGVPYFMNRYDLPKDVAGFMVSMMFFGWAVGGPLYGWFSDRIHRRKSPMFFAAISTLIVMSIILFSSASPFEMKILMFLLGMCSSGFILAFSIVREINIPLLTGTAIGFINTLNNASGALAQPVVGHLLDKLWDGQYSSNGDPIYSIEMYNEALLFLPGCLILALLLLPFVRETFCRPLKTRLEF